MTPLAGRATLPVGPLPGSGPVKQMSRLFERLRDMVLGRQGETGNGRAPALMVTVRCDRCGEQITTRVEKAHALQEQYALESGDPEAEPEVSGYLLEKEILGSHCQNLIHLTMRFDCARRPLDHELQGGTLVEIADHD